MPITDFEKVYPKDTDCPSPIDMFNDTAPAASTELQLVDSNRNAIPPISTSVPPLTETPELKHLTDQLAFVMQEYHAGRMTIRNVTKKVKELKDAMECLSQQSQIIPHDD